MGFIFYVSLLTDTSLRYVRGAQVARSQTKAWFAGPYQHVPESSLIGLQVGSRFFADPEKTNSSDSSISAPPKAESSTSKPEKASSTSEPEEAGPTKSKEKKEEEDKAGPTKSKKK